MIPPDLHFAVGVIAALFVGTALGALGMAALAAGGRADAEQAAFRAGVQYERNARARAAAQLAGDEDAELGRFGA